mmetsp:Transcript_22276/g.32345  ORF Transcript_22276/g.32345 Transcript_22276/m.32345 type:complete len:264 (-) Transcript_22276:210-1001(-)
MSKIISQLAKRKLCCIHTVALHGEPQIKEPQRQFRKACRSLKTIAPSLRAWLGKPLDNREQFSAHLGQKFTVCQLQARIKGVVQHNPSMGGSHHDAARGVGRQHLFCLLVHHQRDPIHILVCLLLHDVVVLLHRGLRHPLAGLHVHLAGQHLHVLLPHLDQALDHELLQELLVLGPAGLLLAGLQGALLQVLQQVVPLHHLLHARRTHLRRPRNSILHFPIFLLLSIFFLNTQLGIVYKHLFFEIEIVLCLYMNLICFFVGFL